MDAAKDLLKRAVELDTAQKYSEAMICYEQGVQNLLRQMKDTPSEGARKELRLRAEQYLERAEHLKQLIKEQERPAESVHSLRIAPGSTGYSYEAVFERCLDGNVHSVAVQDPYIRVRHQIYNFVRFCELLVKKCKKLSKISLTTTSGESPSESSQASSLTELQESLRERGVKLEVAYSPTLHDREIRFSNGWIVKLGRGLDYFQKLKGPFTIGFNDFDLRPCHETTIEMYHKLNVKSVKTQ
ncbi:MIT domain-containing protein 1-like [Halichondria panicea]|uniref:MIT domain-containing protein 1-like n=1 Tax=Halichondria panicea TaxID=6063 RepID=UPI00312B8A0D